MGEKQEREKKKKKEATVPVEGIANLKEEERPKERGIKLLIALLVVAVLLLKASIQYVCLPSSCGGLKPYCLGAACYHRLLEVTQPSCPQQSGAERIAAGSPLSFGHRAAWVWLLVMMSLSLSLSLSLILIRSGSCTRSIKQTGSMKSHEGCGSSR